MAERRPLVPEVPGSSPGGAATLVLVKHVQASLRSGTAVRVCWLPARVRRGDRVTLKNSEEPSRLWDVSWVSTTQRELDEINRGWNNNI